MKLKYMTLEGKVDKNLFFEEWWNSENHDATFLQSGQVIYLIPSGNYKFLPFDEAKIKFAGKYRKHTFVKRDFEIKSKIIGGGYLALNENHNSCFYRGESTDFGAVPDIERVVSFVNKILFS